MTTQETPCPTCGTLPSEHLTRAGYTPPTAAQLAAELELGRIAVDDDPASDRRTVQEVAPDLTDAERQATANAINAAPGEQRPYAERETSRFFVATFALASIERAQYANPSERDAGVSAAAKIRAGLTR